MKFFLIPFLIYLAGLPAIAQESVKGDFAIAPWPVNLDTNEGSFIIDSSTRILVVFSDTSSFDPMIVFRDIFQRKSGYPLNPSKSLIDTGGVENLILITQVPHELPGFESEESYSLVIQPTTIIIQARTNKGIFYALQTLRQIMRMDAMPDADGQTRTWQVPAAQITDNPRFSYRGMHLDVCRHFMPVDFVKKYIDLLAYYKMNTFHWHLTDDQGWRIEIKKYPKLQEIAAWRDETLIGHYKETPDRYDGTRHGGYYTQEEIKEVVSYAADRAVTIVPEIEMPGHALAALSAYPELACTPGPFKAATTWGVFNDVFCPTEETFTFLQNVLDEVMALFPSPFIHIGGDECPKKRWKESAFCQRLMKEKGLTDENQLQSYFVRRIEQYLNSKGRNIIGWDEIMEGGLAPNATVMSWRGVSGGIEAAKAGHDVIMTPGSYCYFDYYQSDPAFEPLAIGGLIPLEKVYAFNPVPAKLTPSEAMHILGAQGNLWTEYIDTPEKAEYMAYPRAIALAEVLWSPSSGRDWSEFAQRLSGHLERLDGMNVNYARHLQTPTAQIRSGPEGLRVIWKTPLPGQEIFFTGDTSSHQWNKSVSGDSTLFVDAGDVFFKTSHSPVRKIEYRPSKTRQGSVSASVPPSSSYPGRQGIATLKDGLSGMADYNGEDWCGWNGPQFSVEIDFQDKIRFDTLRIGTYSSPGSWIYNPQSIEIQGSADHDYYYRLATWIEKDLKGGRNEIVIGFPAVSMRYLRLVISPLQAIPEGKPGAGHHPWTFIDEIGVY